MFDFINYTADKAILLLLILVRMTGLFVTAPVFSEQAIPKMIKVGMVALLSLILVTAVPDPGSFAEIQSNWQLGALVFKEMLIGVVIGLFFRFIFMGISTGGAIVGYQMGFMLANQFDPNEAGQVSIISRFWHVVAILFFLTINGHHLIINAVAESYAVIPAGQASLDGALAEGVMKYSAYVFIIAIKVASPVIVALFLTDVAFGVIAKTMPTMNVFFVGIPVKAAVGLTVMALSLPVFVYVIEKALGYLDSELRLLLLAIGKA